MQAAEQDAARATGNPEPKQGHARCRTPRDQRVPGRRQRRGQGTPCRCQPTRDSPGLDAGWPLVGRGRDRSGTAGTRPLGIGCCAESGSPGDWAASGVGQLCGSGGCRGSGADSVMRPPPVFESGHRVRCRRPAAPGAPRATPASGAHASRNSCGRVSPAKTTSLPRTNSTSETERGVPDQVDLEQLARLADPVAQPHNAAKAARWKTISYANDGCSGTPAARTGMVAACCRRQGDRPTAARRRAGQLGEQAADPADRHADRDRGREQVAGTRPVAAQPLRDERARVGADAGRTGCCGCRRATARAGWRSGAGRDAAPRCRAGSSNAPPTSAPATTTQIRSSVTPRRLTSARNTSAAASTPSPTKTSCVGMGSGPMCPSAGTTASPSRRLATAGARRTGPQPSAGSRTITLPERPPELGADVTNGPTWYESPLGLDGVVLADPNRHHAGSVLATASPSPTARTAVRTLVTDRRLSDRQRPDIAETAGRAGRRAQTLDLHRAPAGGARGSPLWRTDAPPSEPRPTSRPRPPRPASTRWGPWSSPPAELPGKLPVRSATRSPRPKRP